jgi:amino acid adenylation domain-containing protein/FkbH-like protein
MEQLALKDLNEFSEVKSTASQDQLQVNICASFVIEPIQEAIEYWTKKLELPVQVAFAPYHQVFQQLLSPAGLLAQATGVNCLFIRLEDWLRERHDQAVATELDFIDQIYFDLVAAVSQVLKQTNVPFLVGIVPSSNHPRFAPEITTRIDELNQQLKSTLSNFQKIHLLDLEKIADLYDIDEIFDAKSDEIGHIPFTQEFYAALGTFLVRKLQASKGKKYKVIAVDCDNTLWEGVCGELGTLNVLIDENYTYLQEFLIEKYNEGFLIAICSKNNEQDVWDVFEQHPGMKLKREHITAHRIDWNPKPGNLVSIAKELNLGSDSFIFLDDSGFEVEQVSFNSPEILALTLPEDPKEFASFLNHNWAFDVFGITEEDRNRNQMYRAEKQRQQEQVNYSTVDDFLSSLKITVNLLPLEKKDTDRALQLILRTNQFNLNGIRKSREELVEAIRDQLTLKWIIEVQDRFGDYGKTGLLIAKPINGILLIDTFLLSCRVLGRKVEHFVLTELEKYCTTHQLNKIVALFRTTNKNQPFYEFLQSTGWQADSATNTYQYSVNGVEVKEESDANGFIIDAQDNFYEDLQNIQLRRSKPTLPATENELAIYEIWKNVLGHGHFGINDDFFTIGGDSLKAVQLVSRISRHFIADLQLIDFYFRPTINQLAEFIPSKQNGSTPLSVISFGKRPHKIPLSFSQERLWFIDQLEGSIHYHVPEILRLIGNVNKDALQRSLQTIINRHEVLRTVIRDHEGRPFQDIKHPNKWNLDIIDGSRFRPDEGGLRVLINEIINVPFNLSTDDMLRAQLISLDEQEHILIITMHHIASDGWSASIFVREFVELYEAFHYNRDHQLRALDIQYADYALWQRAYLRDDLLNEKISYWKEKLKDAAPLQLPTDFPRPQVQSTRGASFTFQIDKKTTEALQKFSGQQGVTLFMTLLAGFKVLLHNYSGQQDICVGSPVAGRQHPELEELIGFFVNTLALRSDVKDDVSFLDFLKQLKGTILEAYANQEVPFEKVVETVVKERNLSRVPLTQVLFVLQNTPEVPKMKLPNLVLSRENYNSDTSKFDFSFLVTETSDGIQIMIEYSTDLYLEKTIERMAGHYATLLDSITKQASKQIGRLSFLTSSEEDQILNGFNKTIVPYPDHKTVTNLFEEQVQKSPDNVAIVFGQDQLTYKKLNERANQLAHYLHSKNVMEGDMVPICVERGLNMIVGVVAILKAGATYVPIDPDYPVERIGYILADTTADLIISSKKSRQILGDKILAKIIEIDGDWPEISKYPDINLQLNISTETLVYLLYTSGSTGKPKGVKMQGSALVNLLSWQEKEFHNKHRRVLQFPSLNFDASFQDIFSTLCFGSELYLISADRRIDMGEVIKDIRKYKITHLFIPFIVLKNLAEYILPIYDETFPLQEIIVAGEQLKLTDDIKELMRKSGLRLINQYGPTEAHVVSSYTIEPDSELPTLPPIGKPIDNTQLYILNNLKQIVPIGIVGELYIGGVQVARGYLNKHELTAERFIDDPFSRKPGSKMYKTGDLARWFPDGNIEFLGRRDDQVKIRGYRIELGEIETLLQECPLVRQCAVLALDDNHSSKRLVGYVVPEGSFNREAIISYLKENLPEYMVPSLWVEMERLPVTSNGKIDRRNLPQPDANELVSDRYVAPNTLSEIQLSRIWCEILNIQQAGIHDNFFDLGGHSLLAMRVVSAIRKQLQVDLAIRELFLYPNIFQLAAHIEGKRKGLSLPPIKATARPERIPLSFSQERLWFIDQLEGSLHYHLPLVLLFHGNLNKYALIFALEELIKRHEVLRTVFKEELGVPYQYIKNVGEAKLAEIQASQYENDVDNVQQLIDQLIDQPFDLSQDDMLRAHLIELNEEEHLLVVTMHHLVSDGWSLSIFIEELSEFYGSFVQKRTTEVQRLELQYADYAIWQREHLQGELLERKILYWKTKLQGVAPLQLPTNFPRPAIQNTSGAVSTFSINKILSDRLYELSHEHGTTLFMTLQAAFKILLYRYTHQEDICIGSAIADRQQQEVEGLIGFFVNTLALRNELKSDISFIELLEQVRLTTLEAYEHQEVPFEKIVEVVVKERDMSRNPIFQVMLVWQNTPPISQVDLGEVKLIQKEIGLKRTKFDITFIITETQDGLDCVVEYSTALYTASAISRMTSHFTQLLSSIVRKPTESIGNLKLLTPAEEQELLTGVNSTLVDHSNQKTVVHRFEEQVAKTPDNTALIFGEQRLTYWELNERANQMSRYLQGRGVAKQTLVPVCIDRSIDLVVSLLAIMKAGAAYVPIDPGYPSERISYMLEDTRSAVVISNATYKRNLGNVEVIDLDTDSVHIEQQSTENLHEHVVPSDLVYVIYTSGSTGKPKGVLIEHRGLMNLIDWHITEYHVTDKSCATAMAGVGFDAFGWELWPYLCSGSSVHVINDELRLQSNQLLEYFTRHSVSHSFISTALVAELVSASKNQKLALQYLLTGGDKLTALDTSSISYTVVNNYGPTEYTVVTTNYVLSEKDKNRTPPIGRPIANTTVMIVDARQQLVPVGVIGELCVGGPGLARGYLNQADLTNEKFVTVSFENQRQMRLYCTGDLARWLEDGTIEYIGRKDDQIKIRGYRIELGEIESVLLQSGLVTQAIVLVKEDDKAEKQLVGYVVSEKDFDREAVISYLKTKLPDNMVPVFWVSLEALPLTSNGKIDRKALPEPDLGALMSNHYMAAQTPMEQALEEIWKELLHMERVGIHDNFFRLGGHSLLARRMMSYIERKLLVSIPIQMLFQYNTISQLAKYLEIQSPRNQEQKDTKGFKLLNI